MKTKEQLELLVKTFKERTKKPCLAIELTDELNPTQILSNKIGGTPFVPEGCDVPKTTKGDYMSLLLQVNLKDVNLPEWPRSGILEVFTSELYPFESKIVVFDETQPYRKASDLPIVKSEFIDGSWGISLSTKYTFMPFADYRFEKTLNKIIEELFDDHPNNSKYYFGVNDYMNDEFNFPGEKYNWFFNFWPDEEYIPLMLGGYADFTQTDPRGYKNEKVSECLFKIDSNYDMTKITIGDAGIVNGMLSPEDLSEGHLDKALVYWDCC